MNGRAGSSCGTTFFAGIFAADRTGICPGHVFAGVWSLRCFNEGVSELKQLRDSAIISKSPGNCRRWPIDSIISIPTRREAILRNDLEFRSCSTPDDYPRQMSVPFPVSLAFPDFQTPRRCRALGPARNRN